MRLRATVRSVTAKATHLHGVPTSGVIEVTKVPDPKTVEVVEQEGAFYLLRLDGDGRCIADTWHETVEGAKAQASFEYGIEESDWKKIENGVGAP
jgi:hypothetical protein